MRKCFYLVGVLFVFGFAGRLCGDEETYVKTTDTYKRVKAAVDKIRVVDMHEHLPPEKELLKKGAPDFFDIMGDGYDTSDERYLDKSLSVEERWESFLPVYKKMKNRGYVKSVCTGIKKICGIEVTDANSIKKINESLKKLYQPGIYKKIFYETGKVDYVMIQLRWPSGFPKDDYPDFFRGARVIDKMIVFTEQEDIFELEKRYAISVHSVDDMEKIYHKFVEESVASGVVGFKYSGAYLRTLDFPAPNREKADALLKKLLRLTEPQWSWVGGEAFSINDEKELSTYLMHLMLKMIDEKGLPVAFHTGIAAGGEVRGTNPQLLIPLFKEYKNINFDLYHSGFPFVSESIELGKSWPNVYLNMCWSQNLSPSMARRQLSEMLEALPVNKIFAYGGDSHLPENSIGDLEIARENCAIVLAGKVLMGYFTEEEAVDFAERILRTNAIEVYKLKIAKK